MSQIGRAIGSGVKMAEGSYVAVSDRMKYGVKPSAVRSENYLHNIKASNGSQFPMQLGQDIIFDVPALGNGYYCDFSTSYFRCRVDVTLTNTVQEDAGLENAYSNGYVRFERGPESMFRRVMIQDASGNLLESFENYNDLYCLQELLTNNRLNREGPGTFHGEGLVVPGNNTPSTQVNVGSAISALNSSSSLESIVSALKSTDPFNEVVSMDAYNILVQPNGKNPPLKYPDLGGAIIGNYCMGSSSESDNAAEAKYGAWSLWDRNGSAYQYSAGSSGGKYFTFQLASSLFGGSADKYLPMSAINGLRIVLSLENAIGAVVLNGLQSYVASTETFIDNSIKEVRIVDPTFYMNMVRVDPTIDKQLLASAQSEDGAIRIHSQSYSNFQIAIPQGQASWEYIIPIKSSSLKAIYFTFAP